MILKDLALEAQVHEATYVAMLRAALSRRGDKARFAQQTGTVTREYLSYVTSKKRQRDLSPRAAAGIAANLPWPPDVREAFIEHVRLRQVARLRRQDEVKRVLDDYDARDLLSRLHGEFAAPLSPEKPEIARLHYLAVRDLCLELLSSGHPSVHPRQSPLNFAEICLMLCYVQGVLNRPDEALFYSKIVSRLLQERDGRDVRTERERYDTVRIAAMRAEASAYYIMDLPQPSFDVSREARETLPPDSSDPSEVHLIVTQMSALAKGAEGRRFRIGEVRKLASAAHKAAEKLPTEQEYQQQRINIQRTLGAAETQYGHAPVAVRLLLPLVEQSQSQLGGDFVRRAGLLRSYAQAQFAEGDLGGGVATLRTTLTLALDAGLTHQIQQNRKAFGAHAEAILEELTGGIALP